MILKATKTYENFPDFRVWTETLYQIFCGSSTQISDISANIIHHIEYMPYGESFVEQRSNWGTNYKFNGKELDEETGYYYYGARYYNPDISIWLSVDPLSDKYPSTSAYMYTLGNPIKFIDPNGMFHTEPERMEAINRAYQHVNKKSTYQYGGSFNAPGGGNDCSGMIADIMTYVGYSRKGVYGKGMSDIEKQNGVSLIVSNTKPVSVEQMEEGNFVTFRTNRPDKKGPDGLYDHIGIVTKIDRNDDGDITSFNFIHSSNKEGANEMNYDFTNSKKHTTWGNNNILLKGVYKWDSDDMYKGKELPTSVINGGLSGTDTKMKPIGVQQIPVNLNKILPDSN